MKFPKSLASLMLLAWLPAWAAPPAVALAVSAKPERYWSFWRGETASGYREKILAAVKPLLAETTPNARIQELSDPGLPDQLYQDQEPWPRHQALCHSTGANNLLILRVQDTFPVISPWQADLFGGSREAPSAHWPALYLTAYDCRSGQHLTEHPILSPRNTDHFVFETDLIDYTRSFWNKALARPDPND